MLSTAHRSMRTPKRAMYDFRNSGNPYPYIQKMMRGRESRTTISRPQRNIASAQRLQSSSMENKPERPRPNTEESEVPNTYNTGIIGHSQYASPEEPSNWREVWKQAKRPERPNAAEEKGKRNSTPRIKQDKGTDIDINAKIKVNKRPLTTTVSGDLDAEVRQKGRTVKVTGEGEAKRNVITKNIDASGRADIEAVQRLKGGGSARVYVEGEGKTTIKPKRKRPITGQEDTGKGTQGRPVTGGEEIPYQEARKAPQSRPATNDGEMPHQKVKKASQSRPVTNDGKIPRQEVRKGTQGRPATDDEGNPYQEAKKI